MMMPLMNIMWILAVARVVYAEVIAPWFSRADKVILYIHFCFRFFMQK